MRAPGSASYRRRRADADALVEIVMPVGSAAGVAQDFEDRERPAEQRDRRLREGLTITNCPGCASAATSGAASARTL